MTFQTEQEFLSWLCKQTEEYYTYDFRPDSAYPLAVSVERKPNRVIIREIS